MKLYGGLIICRLKLFFGLNILSVMTFLAFFNDENFVILTDIIYNRLGIKFIGTNSSTGYVLPGPGQLNHHNGTSVNRTIIKCSQ